ncbi:fasciclin domain-containing protein [Pedobacter deserti]|uniref:fasciclin domain-containing protein n=1 Tax=Pedobacter deserti TaxID=2817382 RepID=UPI0021092696|nr:fasciclin domain-containing protein [Pedobacter sp. SYSU D00382]
MTNKYFKTLALCSALLILLIGACKQDDYYLDGGKADPKFNGNILQYLESNPAKFDTLVRVIRIAGLEDMFANEEITFFAPTDEVFRRTIGQVNRTSQFNGDPYVNKLNQELFRAGTDTIANFEDVPAEIWRRYLMRYVFKGKMRLRDYPQLDPNLRQLYPGGYFYTYERDLANIGVVFNSANNIAYAGARQISFSFLPDPSNPELYYSAAVATSDVQPTNGVVHVLAVFAGAIQIGELFVDPVGSDNFGFNYEFNTDVLLNR